MAIYWPTPGFKGRTFKLCVLTRRDFNFCVRSSPLREKEKERLFVTFYFFMNKTGHSNALCVCVWLLLSCSDCAFHHFRWHTRLKYPSLNRGPDDEWTLIILLSAQLTTGAIKMCAVEMHRPAGASKPRVPCSRGRRSRALHMFQLFRT